VSVAFEIPKPEESYNGKTFMFMGWEFKDSEFTDPAYPEIRQGHLISHHRLHNPDPPEAYYAYRGYKVDSTYFHSTREYAAAWLISHWFEHYIGTCPCLKGDGPSNFRTAFIETLLG
jgi:hypothetical protein